MLLLLIIVFVQPVISRECCCPTGKLFTPNDEPCLPECECHHSIKEKIVENTKILCCDEDPLKNDVLCEFLFDRDSGVECETNSQCKSEACGFDSADAEFRVCCESADLTPFDGDQYCTGLIVDRSCHNDDMCSSNYCQGSDGGAKIGICNERHNSSEECNTDEDCNNDHCGHPNFHTHSHKICCPSNDVVFPLDGSSGDTAFCTFIVSSVPPENICYSSLMCISGLCDFGKNSDVGVCIN
jgi:hypothetical protein